MQQVVSVRTYPVACVKQSDGSTKIQVQLSPGVTKSQRAIYMFYSKTTGKCLVGATTSLRGRVHKYHSEINGKKKLNEFLRDIRERPTDFSFSILEVVGPEFDLQEREQHFIKLTGSFQKGYNQNRGGGGSFARSRIESAVGTILKRPSFQTPQRKYPFKATDQGIRVDFGTTPTKVKKRLIYSILEEKGPTDVNEEVRPDVNGRQGQDGPRKRTHQIGLTTQPLGKRIGQHLHIINNPAHPETEKPLYSQIRQNPERFYVAMMHQAEEGEDLAELEKIAIQTKPLTFNLNRGGGGIQGFRKK